MSELALFLEAEAGSIIELFVARSRQEEVARGLSRRTLIDHLPVFLRELAGLVRKGGRPDVVVVGSGASEKHGEERLHSGYDVEAIVREYGTLLDCVLERMAACGIAVTHHELRILSGGVFASSHQAIAQYLQNQRAEQEAERVRLLGIFEGAPSFVAVTRGPEHRYELTNAAYQRLIGHRQVIGKTVADALPEVVEQGYLAKLDEVYRTGTPIEGRGAAVALQHAPGAPVEHAFLDFVFAPIVDQGGMVSGILHQGHDVTAAKRDALRRRAAEVALQASEERLRTLIEHIDDGYCVIELLPDASGRFTDWIYTQANAAFAHQSGLQNAVGKRIRELVPDQDPFWFELYTRVVTSGEPARTEYSAEAMGRSFDVFAVRVGPAGSREVAVLFRDTTARRRNDAERERLLALEKTARARAEDAGRLKDEFLATLSHELRTPLNAVIGWVDMLQRGRLSPEKQKLAVDIIARNAHAQAQLIEDLLDMSRIMAGKLRLELSPVNLAEVLQLAIDSAKPSADAKAVRLLAALESEATALADAHRLQQVIANLLSNAVKFTPAGGEVRVCLESEDSVARIDVIDTGRGIKPDFLPHVFERFRQEGDPAGRLGTGLGLGLAITHQLVALHGGEICAASAGEGRGAQFTVRLPLALTHSAAPERDSSVSGDGLELAGMRVVIVEDDADSREMLAAALESADVAVRAASGVREGIELLAAELPDAVVTDLSMPGQDGYAMLERARALAGGEQLPVIALTALAHDRERARARAAGFDEFLTKPLDERALRSALARVRAYAR